MPETELIATVTSILEKELAVALGMSLPLFQLEARQKQEKDRAEIPNVCQTAGNRETAASNPRAV